MSVAKLYQKKSGELKLRDYNDVKRYCNVKLCNSNRKVTGQSSAPPITAEAQRIYNKTLQKMGTGDYGGGSEVSDSENEVCRLCRFKQDK